MSCLIVGGGELDKIWAHGFAAMHPDAMTIACDSGIRFFRQDTHWDAEYQYRRHQEAHPAFPPVFHHLLPPRFCE